jgi:hypothetical protein
LTITLGIQYKTIKWDTKEKQKNIRKFAAGRLSSMARSKGTKNTKARKAIWIFGKASA